MGKHDSEIDAVFADIDALHHPGAAILVIDRDEIICSKGYGLADLETRQPITTDTSFYLASISKQFTAMAIMLLEERYRLSLDDRLHTYFPDFPSWGAGITLRHLLHHTSGLPGYIQFFSSSEDIAELTRSITGINNEDVFEKTMRLSGPEFPVGSQYSYSGVGYVLLAVVVAIVSGQSFADFLRSNVFEPLGMKHTLAYDSCHPTRHRLAHGYLREGDRFERWDYPMLTVGDGGLFSTLSDLFLWDQALNTERLVSKATLRRTFTSGTTNDGAETGYGFGWITNVFPYLSAAERQQLLGLGGGADIRHVAHGGSCIAYFNYMIRFLEAQRTIIVLTNRGPIAPASAPPGHPDFPGPRVRAHQVAEILFGN
ncbi:serine hydrolase domain-containing protein [Rhizobium sp. P44RR-XXIV]|uniref:serine hydrolase domain-containing protein n=1 Tax=Rhizobium sp. P44RR-XXIV TaxID=1921145 RepID=UPI00098421A6|nr:serine hydrolase domain-containing protein [Rhizobium sp. P44RR-XXIV]TIX90328.1 beta-lactamase family protein [Rhizobium sp. P44RR-XXIV]